MSEPRLEYILFCDKILTDRSDGRETFVGLFQSLSATQFPFTAPPFQIKIAIQDFRYSEQNPSVVINIKHPRTSAVIGSNGARLDQIHGVNSASTKNPISLKLGFGMKSLTYSEPGKYEVQLLLENEPFASRFLEIRSLHKSKPQ